MELHTDTVGDVAIVECDGPIACSDAAIQLREEVTLHDNARVIVLDLSEVNALDGKGLSTLAFLQQWSREHDVQFKLFNPRYFVRDGLEQASSTCGFEIVSLPDLMALLMKLDKRRAVVS